MTLRRLGTSAPIAAPQSAPTPDPALAPQRPRNTWTAVIVNYNSATYLPPCIEALQQSTLPPEDIIVVDNASTDDSLQELHGYPRVRVEPQSRNLGFAGGANTGLALVETDLALLLNPDVEVEPGLGAALQAVFARNPDLGAAGALLLYPDSDRIQHAGGIIDAPLCTTRHRGYGEPRSREWEQPADCEFVTGGALGLRMTAFRSVGGFDTSYHPVYYEDVDLCVRLRAASWHVQYRPELIATHHEGVTLQQSAAYFRFLHRNRLRFAMQHLTPSQWDAFVVAEFERLRHALGETPASDADWAALSGAAGIEDTLHAADTAGLGPLLSASTSANARAELATVTAWVASLQQPTSGMRKPGRWRARFGKALVGDVHGVLERQQAFNAAVVSALQTQEAVNREQVARELVQLLNLVYRLEHLRAHASGPNVATS